MSEVQCSVKYGDDPIEFRLTYSKRKSLEISVYPNGAVAVKAPLGTNEDLVMRRVRKRSRWIKKQIDYFSQFEPRTPKRRFVGGESHLYLGRKYRLKITQSKDEGVLLKRGFFHIGVSANKPETVSALLENWYRSRADLYFSQVFENCWENFQKKGLEKPALKIRKMKTRWGSLSPKGKMTLNQDLIKAPRECIEYVVIHELCHLLHHNHGKEFYNLLDHLLPDWTKRKHKLEKVLS